MKDIKDASERVREYLRRAPDTRDNDNFLVALVWWDDLKKLYGDPNNCGLKKFMQHLKDGNLSSYDSITRSRRKWQEEVAPLRGKRYVERKTKRVDEAKKDIKDFKKRPQNKLF